MAPVANLTVAEVGSILGGVTGIVTAGVAIVRAMLHSIRKDYELCLRDRKQLRHDLTLVQGALLGLLPEETKLSLLGRLSKALDDSDEPRPRGWGGGQT